MPRALALFLLLALGGAALLLLLVFSDTDSTQGDPDEIEDVVETGVSDLTDEEKATPSGDIPFVEEEHAPVVPRVLPPDAAIEDVRDALAAKDAEALREADLRIGRLATSSRETLRAIQRQISKTDDPRVRGVALAATGADDSETSLRFLCGRLQPDATPEEIIGAMAGIFRDRRVDKPERTVFVAQSLGGLSICVHQAPLTEYVKRALIGLLDSDRAPQLVEGEEMSMLLSIATGRSVELAELLVFDGELRPYLMQLTPDGIALVRQAALGHSDLSGDARRAFEAK